MGVLLFYIAIGLTIGRDDGGQCVIRIRILFIFHKSQMSAQVQQVVVGMIWG